jgi:hypothetical protein
MDKLEQIKETIEGSAELLDKQQEYNFQFDEIIRTILENGYDRIKSDWPGTTYLNPRLYNIEYPETDVRYYWDSQYKYRNDIRPIWTNVQTTTSGSDAVVAMPRHLEEWCDFVTDDVIQF